MVRRWRIEVVRGPGRGALKRFTRGVIRIGSADSNDLTVDDPKMSRQHLEIQAGPLTLIARDLGSKNGTYYQSARIASVELPLTGAVLTLGDSAIAIVPDDDDEAESQSLLSCGRLVGRGPAMQRLFRQILRIAPSNATVLIQGETGSGKELVAEAIHQHSPRRERPFVIVDCASIPHALVESELFGHVRGAFTGATADRRGAFVRAHGGTIFIDEIGELDPELQPRLLRVLETGSVKAVGSDHPQTVDVRVIAASFKSISDEVRERRFREDLFYRLAIVELEVPPLRGRLEDLPLLVEHFLQQLGAPPPTADSLRVLQSYAWPGNVRQLKNTLERAAALAGNGPLVIRREDLPASTGRTLPPDVMGMPYKEAKESVVSEFTKDYIEELIQRHGGNVSAAAREARVDRKWLIELARRFGIPTRSKRDR